MRCGTGRARASGPRRCRGQRPHRRDAVWRRGLRAQSRSMRTRSGRAIPKTKTIPTPINTTLRHSSLRSRVSSPRHSGLIEDRLEGAFTESYMPLGDIYIEFSGVDELPQLYAPARPALGTGHMRVRLRRRAHSPAPRSRRIPIRYSCCAARGSQPGRINFKLRFETQLRAQASAQAGSITVDLRAPSHVDPNYVDSTRSRHLFGCARRDGQCAAARAYW